MTPSDADLKALLARIGQKDKQAFSTLYREMEKPLFRFVMSKLNDPFQSGDILHEVFLEIWKNAARFEGRSAAKTWMFGIAYRKVMDVFRKSARLDVTDDLPDRADDAPAGEACLLAAQEADHVRHCLSELKPQQRGAIELAFFEDMSYRDISQAMDVPEGTVKTRVFHAKQLLMRCLQARMKIGSLT